jgi:acyl-CoA reductase-like NAD-dependent aldehyde dehydrogenase
MTQAAQTGAVQEWGYRVGGSAQTSAERVEVRSPHDGSLVGVTFVPTDADVEEAVQAAVAAFAGTEELPSYRRAEILSAIANGIEQRREEFTRLIILEAGKPRKQAAVEVERALFNFRHAAAEAQRLPHELLDLDQAPSMRGRWGLVRRFPIGPILAITPFNFPLNLVVHKLAPAIACGNPVVLKPAPQTPLTALLLGQVVAEAGLPAGALSVLPCSIAQAERLVGDDRLKMLSFTGSAAVGWKLKALSGRKRVVLELGGNAGVLIHCDADLKLAAERCAVGGFAYAGQTCISVQRILVHEDVKQKFLDGFLGRVRALQMGDPMDAATDVGPMVSLDHARRIETWVQEALSGGARLLAGGRRQGSFYQPTVLTATRPEMRVNCLEVFAPVVTVEGYKDFDAAVACIDASPFGLQAGVFTRDVELALRAFRRLRVGGVMLNEVPTFRADPMPYGGTKDSGLGREGVRYAIAEMTEPRIMVLNVGS